MQTKPLSWDQIRANAAAFVHEWAGESYERGESQSFWTDLFAVYGVRRRAVARFEARARKADGGGGFIDVFWPGMLIAEQKSLGKDLAAAGYQDDAYLLATDNAVVVPVGKTVLMQVTAPGDELVLVGVDVGGHGGLLSVGAGRHGVGRWMGPSGPIGQPSRYQTTIMAVHTRPIASE